MSDVELLEATGPWWAAPYAVLLIALFVAGCWVLIHPHLTWRYLLTVLRRGRNYRRRIRRARHRQRRDSLHYLTFRSPAR